MCWKRIIACGLTLSLIAALAACGKEENKPKPKSSETASVISDGSADSSVEETGEESVPAASSGTVSRSGKKKSSSAASSKEEELDFDRLLDHASGEDGYSTSEVQNGQYAVVSTQSARVSAAKITNAKAKNMGKLKVENVTLFDFDKNWAFNHAAFITYFKGMFYAYWMQGRANEDDVGQRIVGTTSKDFKHWAPVTPISDSKKGILNPKAETVQSPGGYFNDGKQLMMFYSSAEYAAESLRNNGTLRPLENGYISSVSYVRTLKADGTWGPEMLNRKEMGGILSAFQLKSGRWIFPSGTGVRYSDDGKIWYRTGASAAQVEDAKARGAHEICEPGCYETGDGVLHVLLRSDAEYLWQTQSADGGKTWSDIYPTKFTNDSSKFQTGRLADGRYYIIGNTKVGGGRCPLSISLSNDGYNYTKEYIIRDEYFPLIQQGLAKGGTYGYPTCCTDDKYMYVVYSINKETIHATRFLLSDLK